MTGLETRTRESGVLVDNRYPIVRSVDLTRRFDTIVAVDRVMLAVFAGEAFGLCEIYDSHLLWSTDVHCILIDRELSRSVRRYPCLTVVRIVVKTTSYHEIS